MPNSTKLFIIESDVSKSPPGQSYNKKTWIETTTPVDTYHTPSMQNNKTMKYDWELMSIVYALEMWRHYLQGSPFSTVILSDHKNLTYFRTTQKLNRQQAQ